MRDMLKPALVLFVAALVTSLILCVMQAVTKDIVAANEEKVRLEAMREVLPFAGEFSEAVETGEVSGVVSLADCLAPDGAVLGTALTVVVKGYGGDMTILVGTDGQNAVTGVRLLSHTETPGLGTNAEKDVFLSQYTGKTGALSVSRTSPCDNEIQAITSATITSRAVTEGVNAALAFNAARQAGGAQ